MLELLSRTVVRTCPDITVETRLRDGDDSKFGDGIFGLSFRTSNSIELCCRVSNMGCLGRRLRLEKGGITHEFGSGASEN